MDPISALIIACIAAPLIVRTLGKGAVDVAATVRGKEPPSQERWRKRQEDRAAKGLPREASLPPWRRLWREQVERSNAKSAQKHAAEMEWLRENEDENKARHKERLLRRQARREKVRDGLARGAGVSWEKAKGTATAARDKLSPARRAEQAARARNDQRDPVPERDAAEDLLAPETAKELLDGDPAPEGVKPGEADDPGATVVPFKQRGDRGDRGDGRGHKGSAAAGEQGPAPREYLRDLSEEERAKGLRDSAQSMREHGNEDLAQRLETSAERHEATAAATGGRTSTGTHSNGQTGTTTSSPGSESTINERNSDMQHSGEITDLPSAIVFFSEGGTYFGKVSGELDETGAQARATAEDSERMAAVLETAQSTLTGLGFSGGEVATKLSGIGERLAALKTVSEELEKALSSAQDELASAGNDMSGLAQFFQNQTGVAEQLASQTERADKTEFYVNG
ncbi:hypothetical protein [Amycolatopsis minnesotensis]|uniref:Uncharacterized protein n=1 Tax=Amycolatopsis minnesotensis TaxID=337894 RepID=A0ABN2SAL9_9PSEU